MKKKLSEKEINYLIKNNIIMGIYGDNSFGKTLFLINAMLNSIYFKNNCVFITSDDTSEIKTKIISASLKESLSNTNINFYDEVKKNTLKNLKILKVNEDIDNLTTIINQRVDKNDNNLIFIDDLDLIIRNFIDNGEIFIEKFTNLFKNSNLIYTYKFPALTGFAKKTNLMFAIRDCCSDLVIENMNNKKHYLIPLEEDSYSFQFSQKFFIDYSKQCSCGAIKTYGKNAIKNSIYHLSFCDLY